MKLKRRNQSSDSSLRKKIIPEADANEPVEGEADEGSSDLDSMSRAEMKQYIKDNKLSLVVLKSMSDDALREAIKDEQSGDEANAEAADEDEAADEANDEADESVDLDKLDRSELKALIKEQSLSVKVVTSMSDDDIREAIAEAVGAEEPEETSEVASDEAETSSGTSAVSSWMRTGKDIDEEVKNAALSRKEFAPTFFVPDGASKVVRFRDSVPICGIYMYSAHNGKYWDKFTQPPDPDDDLFLREGKRASFYLVYELIDRSPYVSKKDKKTHKDNPKLWIIPENVHKQLQHIASKRGKLTDVDLEIHREGLQRPAYTIMEDSSMGALPSRVKELPRLSKNIPKYFTPPSVAEQKRLLRLTSDADNSAEQAG